MLHIVVLDRKYVSIGSRMSRSNFRRAHKWEIHIVKGSTFLVFNLSLPSLSAELPPNHVLREILVAIAERSHRWVDRKSDMWPLFLELLLCTAVLLFAPSPQIGLGVWGVYWWTKVFWRWATSATSATSASPPDASEPSPDPPNSPASGESPAPTLSAQMSAQETISKSKRRNSAQKKKRQRSRL